jgi:hypothetical protein
MSESRDVELGDFVGALGPGDGPELRGLEGPTDGLEWRGGDDSPPGLDDGSGPLCGPLDGPPDGAIDGARGTPGIRGGGIPIPGIAGDIGLPFSPGVIPPGTSRPGIGGCGRI